MKYILIPLMILFFAAPDAAALTSSEARACNAMAASFKPKRAEFDALTAQRDALSVAVEEAGEAWDAAEALRNFGAENAAEADNKKTVYDAAVVDFDTAEFAYRATGLQLNEDFAAYNQKCATDD